MEPSVATSMTAEHRAIDEGIIAFVEQCERGVVDPAPLLEALVALRRHIYMEGTFLFPPVLETGLVMPILVMLREHAALWQLIDALTEAVTKVLSNTVDGPHDEELLSLCETLLAQLEHHNLKEEPIIYPRADLDLPEESRAELATFIEGGRIPEGWTCEGYHRSER